MEAYTVAVVSRDPAVCDSIRELVESAGLKAKTFPSLQAFLSADGPGRRGCLVVDHSGDHGGPEWQSAFAQCCARMAVISIAARGDVGAAVGDMRAGARDVVQKPYSDSNLLASINKVLEENAPLGS